MNDKLFSIRALEAFITLCTTYLALNSFFSSSIYEFISKMTKWILEEMGFILKVNLNASTYMPIILTLLVFTVILYEFIMGEEKNTINIYQLNFMLFLPEALCFSKLNWFNLLDAGYLLRPQRGFTQVFLTGVIIMTGYIILTFTAQHRAAMREFLYQGVDFIQLREVIENQAIFSFVIGIVSAFSILIASLLIPVFSTPLLEYTKSIPFSYVVLGVISSIGLIYWAILIVRKNIE
ncbi:MAG: hypothetical protein E4H14_19785, partial [Candidatus Thorarchaeota archaeon]